MTCNRLRNFAFKSAKAEPCDSISLSKAYLSKAERPMRVAVFVVFVAILATASEASQSCMTRTAARRHSGSTHLYWHGPGHGWDATSTRQHHRIHHVREQTTQEDQRKTEHQGPPQIEH